MRKIIFVSLVFSFYLLSFFELKDNNITVQAITVNNSVLSEVENYQRTYNNSDIEAVLAIDNEEFNYPVAKTTDNDYYLEHNYYKNKDKYGSIFMDYRTNIEDTKKVLIYGHSSKYTSTPFNTLEKYYNEDYYNNHKYITLKTKNNNYTYEIFSVYVETKDFSYMNLSFDNEKYLEHINSLKDKSIYKSDVELNPESKIVILQTCSNKKEYVKNNYKYLLVIGKYIEK